MSTNSARHAVWKWIAWSTLPVMVLSMAPAEAHGWIFPQQNVWGAWQLDPPVTIPTLLLIPLYLVGLDRSRCLGRPISAGRNILFFIGILFFYLALQSPIDPMADRSFLDHQVEHMLLRILGPMFLTLAAPAVPLLRGLPHWVKHRIAKPVIRNRAVRTLFSILSNPYVATLTFIGTLYVWQIPVLHDAAILDDGLHDLMHLTMVLSGLFFFWMVFDFRPQGARASYRLRFVLLFVVLLSNILLGSYLTLKGQPLYSAYDLWGRLWGVSPLKDESWGGLVIWIPSSMMVLVAMIIVFSRMVRADQVRATDLYRCEVADDAVSEP
ncbi:MAG: cytochrome c oxidase assembly protein [Sulfobacillus sp.]